MFTGKHVGPFGFFVPVEFADHAGIEAHVDAGDFGGSSEFADGGLASPAAFFDADVRVGETPGGS